MGKNQQHKAAQQARHSGAGADEPPPTDQGDGTVDVSFHSPEWHAARIAALTTERVSWEDFKKKQKDEERMAASAAEDEEKAMLEYRAQLDADRQSRLAKGVNNAHLKTSDPKSSKEKKRKRSDKDKKKGSKDKKSSKDKKRKEKKTKRSKKRRSGSTSSSDSSESEPAAKKASSPMRLSEFLKG